MQRPMQSQPAGWRKGLGLLLVLAVLGTPGVAAADEAEYDEQTGLRIAPGWETVRNTCIVCHSARQILQQRGSRHTWDSVITWMQQRGGLWELEPAVRQTILDYLVTYHGPKASTRRPAIPAYLMPPNPYARPLAQAQDS